MTAKQVVSIQIESGGEVWQRVRVQRLSGREAIGQLFSFDVNIVCDLGHDLPESAQLDEEASIVFLLDEVEVRRVHGVIGAIRAHVGALHGEDRASYRLRVVPRAARLALVETQEVYLGQSIPDILRAKLERHGFERADYDLRIMDAYAPREIVVQYAESDLAFVSRLAEHVGIGLSFEHEDGRDRLVFSDHPDGYARLAGRAEVPFLGRGEKGGVFALDRVSELTPTSYIVQDHNYRTPRVDLSACADLCDRERRRRGGVRRGPQDARRGRADRPRPRRGAAIAAALLRGQERGDGALGRAPRRDPRRAPRERAPEGADRRGDARGVHPRVRRGRGRRRARGALRKRLPGGPRRGGLHLPPAPRDAEAADRRRDHRRRSSPGPTGRRAGSRRSTRRAATRWSSTSTPRSTERRRRRTRCA